MIDDDYHVNTERVNADLPSVNTMHFVVSVTSLEEAIETMELKQVLPESIDELLH